MARSQLSDAMPCHAVSERLEAAIDGDLDARDLARLSAHLQDCAACAAEHRLAQTIREELRALPQLDAPESVIAGVLQQRTEAGSWFRHRSAKARHADRGRRFRRSAMALAAALALAVAGGILWTLQEQRPGTPEAAVSAAAAEAVAIERATEEARFALAYLQQIHRRAGLKIRQDLLIERLAQPTARALSQSLSSGGDRQRDEASENLSDRS